MIAQHTIRITAKTIFLSQHDHFTKTNSYKIFLSEESYAKQSHTDKHSRSSEVYTKQYFRSQSKMAKMSTIFLAAYATGALTAAGSCGQGSSFLQLHSFPTRDGATSNLGTPATASNGLVEDVDAGSGGGGSIGFELSSMKTNQANAETSSGCSSSSVTGSTTASDANSDVDRHALLDGAQDPSGEKKGCNGAAAEGSSCVDEAHTDTTERSNATNEGERECFFCRQKFADLSDNAMFNLLEAKSLDENNHITFCECFADRTSQDICKGCLSRWLACKRNCPICTARWIPDGHRGITLPDCPEPTEVVRGNDRPVFLGRRDVILLIIVIMSVETVMRGLEFSSVSLVSPAVVVLIGLLQFCAAWNYMC